MARRAASKWRARTAPPTTSSWDDLRRRPPTTPAAHHELPRLERDALLFQLERLAREGRAPPLCTRLDGLRHRRDVLPNMGSTRRRVSSGVAGSRARRWRGHEGTARYRRRGCEPPRVQRCQRSERTAVGTPCPAPRPPPAPPRARQGYDAPSRSVGRLRRCWSRRQTCAQVARGM